MHWIHKHLFAHSSLDDETADTSAMEAHVQELPPSTTDRDTGFPEPLSTERNTTLPHPDADTSGTASIGDAECVSAPRRSLHRPHLLHRLSSKSSKHASADPAFDYYASIQYADGSEEKKTPMAIAQELKSRDDVITPPEYVEEINIKEKIEEAEEAQRKTGFGLFGRKLSIRGIN